jgi:hypothetical protein
MCGWEDVLDDIEELQGDDEHRFHFAEKSLSGIAEWVKKEEHVTPGQIKAVSNIRASRD